MSDTKPVLYCCNEESTWVENVPGKGYNYCKQCKKEVLTPQSIEEPYNDYLSNIDDAYISSITSGGYDPDDLQELLDQLDQFGSYKDPTTKSASFKDRKDTGWYF